MKPHTGEVMPMGAGVLITMSTKQNLTTKSSTEPDLVGLSNSMPFNMWSTYFFKAQLQDLGTGNAVIWKHNALYQDNESHITLAKNGKVSSIKHTCHIHICYLFVTGRVKNKGIEIISLNIQVALKYQARSFTNSQREYLQNELPVYHTRTAQHVFSYGVSP